MSWAYYNEFDPGAAEWLRELIKVDLIAPGEVDERSILDVTADELSGFAQCHFFAGIGGWSCALRRAGWPDERAVWTGSPPCQPFSVAGRGDGRDDERHLAPHFIGLVRDARPPVLFGEQVASSAVFGKAAGSPKRGSARPPEWAWFDDLSDRLEAAHYAVGASDIPAAGVGAPHIRQRTFFGAYDLRLAAGGVVNSLSPRLERHGRHGRDCHEPRRLETEPNGSVGAPSASGGLADSNGQRTQPAGDQEGAGGLGRGGEAVGMANQHSDRCDQRRKRLPAPGDDGAVRDGAVERLADRNGARPLSGAQSGVHRGQESAGARHGEFERCSPASPGIGHNRPGPLSGFWGNADWLFSRDGKWRPAEPGTLPLAHGVSGRVGLLRGYGNAICPQAAEEFIRAFKEVISDVKEQVK